jgi:hypothetical protein
MLGCGDNVCFSSDALSIDLFIQQIITSHVRNIVQISENPVVREVNRDLSPCKAFVLTPLIRQ